MHVGIPMHLSISTLGSRCISGEDSPTAGGLDGQKALHPNVSFLKKNLVNRFKKPPKINNQIKNQIKNRSVLLCSHTLRAHEHMQTRSVTYASTNEVAERSVGWNSWSGLSSASSSPPAARKFLVTSNIFNCTTSAFNIRFISVAHVSEMYIASFFISLSKKTSQIEMSTQLFQSVSG